MEPRLISRGKWTEAFLAGGYSGASMEPRLISRGKLDSHDPLPQITTCFNGAAADQPRKDALGHYVVILRAGASMEPRLISRGKLLGDGDLNPKTAKLQWSRG